MTAACTTPSQLTSPRRESVIVSSGSSPPTARWPFTVSSVPVALSREAAERDRRRARRCR